jgi:ribosomal protein S19
MGDEADIKSKLTPQWLMGLAFGVLNGREWVEIFVKNDLEY